MRWMNLDPVIKSEVSQKEKNKYCITMHIHRVWKNGADEPISRAAIDAERTDWVQAKVGREA